MKEKRFQRVKMAVRLLTCLLILSAVAIQRNGRLLGHDVDGTHEETAAVESPVVQQGDDVVVNTSAIAKDIKGYGGPVPLEITISGNKIAAITPARNAESPEFFGKVERELIPKWIGVPVDEVAATEIDGVTGATLSSNATNATIKAGVAYALKSDAGHVGQSPAESSAAPVKLQLKQVAALIVIVAAMTLPLFIRNKRYRYVQLALNVVVSGFWCGTFLSYTLFVNYLSNGVNVLAALPWLLMLVAAFIYPYFGKKSHYCTWMCPLGSIQELAGRSVGYKLKLTPAWIKRLNAFHDWLWLALMLVMCAGIWSSWMNYELFTAFLFRQAAVGVLIAAGAFVLLSFVVMRPYCRFVCPTGCLFQITQHSDKITER